MEGACLLMRLHTLGKPINLTSNNTREREREREMLLFMNYMQSSEPSVYDNGTIKTQNSPILSPQMNTIHKTETFPLTETQSSSLKRCKKALIISGSCQK